MTGPSRPLASRQAAQPKKKKKKLHGNFRSSPFKTRKKTERPKVPEVLAKAMTTKELEGKPEQGV